MQAKRAVVALSVAAVVGLAPVAAIARNGADDPPRHDARDDRVRTTAVEHHRANDNRQRGDRVGGVAFVVNDRARGSHDDPPGDDHGRHRHHDGLRAANADGSREAEPADDRGANEAQPGDDNGGMREAEPNDDRGTGETEPGDDHGSGEAEHGDDHGGLGNEPGDDHGGR